MCENAYAFQIRRNMLFKLRTQIQIKTTLIHILPRFVCGIPFGFCSLLFDVHKRKFSQTYLASIKRGCVIC